MSTKQTISTVYGLPMTDYLTENGFVPEHGSEHILSKRIIKGFGNYKPDLQCVDLLYNTEKDKFLLSIQNPFTDPNLHWLVLHISRGVPIAKKYALTLIDDHIMFKDEFNPEYLFYKKD